MLGLARLPPKRKPYRPLAAGGRGGSGVPAGGSAEASRTTRTTLEAARPTTACASGPSRMPAPGGGGGTTSWRERSEGKGGSADGWRCYSAVPWAAHRLGLPPLAGGRRRRGTSRSRAGCARRESVAGLSGRAFRQGWRSSAVKGFGGVGGQGLGRTGGAGRRGAATGTRGGVAGMAGWWGRWGGGRARGRAGGAELASLYRPEGAGAGSAGRRRQEPARRARGGPGGSRGWRPRGWRGGGAEGGREERPTDRSAGAPESRSPEPPPEAASAYACNPSPESSRSCMDRPQLWIVLPSPPLVAKGYAAYGGRCRRGGRRGFLEPLATERGTSGGATAEGGGAPGGLGGCGKREGAGLGPGAPGEGLGRLREGAKIKSQALNHKDL